MNHPTPLAAKVAAVNRANAEALRLSPILSAAFAPFVGQAILNQDDNLLAKVAKALPELPYTPGLQVWHDTSSYSLRYGISAHEAGPRYSLYHGASLYVGNMSGATLTKLADAATHFRTDWTEAEVAAKGETLSQAKQAARDAESALGPFGEYDR